MKNFMKIRFFTRRNGDFMENLLQVGVITTTHGVRGEVKVFPTTDDAARFKKLKQVILDTGKEHLALEIAGVKFFKNMVILKFKGYDNINDVEMFRKKSLYVTRENAVKLKKNEYFIADLIGLKVISDEGEDLGELTDVLQTGANDVYVISKEGADDILLPAIKDCVKQVDIEGGTMQCRLLNWEQNEVPLNIGGYKFDKKTKTFPVFINYDKAENISDTTRYEDHFVPGFRDRLIAISKSGRSMQSEDVQNFLKAKERGIQVELFVRKNKDDKISKEFYYLGHMTASGNAKEFTMANTEKTAVEIEWILDVPVREDIYEYIVNA
jgi:16S rRNA processing protein RimM